MKRNENWEKNKVNGVCKYLNDVCVCVRIESVCLVYRLQRG